MNLAICIPFYLRGIPVNRPYLLTMRHYASLGYTLHLCGSEGRLSREFASQVKGDNVHYFEVPQDAFCNLSAGDDNIRRKFNDSLKTLRGRDYDWYCLAGADDIVPQEFFEALAAVDPNIVAMAGVASDRPLYIQPENFTAPPFRVKLQYKVQLLPGINCFTKMAMEKVAWQPYQQRGCETGAERLIASLGMIVRAPGYVVMLKGKGNLNTTSKIAKTHGIIALNETERKLVRSYIT